MDPVGRSCGACGASIEERTDGEGCGRCEVVLCAACRAGTSRCPGCQGSLGEARAEVALPEVPLAEEQHDYDVERGRRQVMAAAVTLGGALMLLAVLGASTGRGVFLQGFAIGLLLLQVFRGRGWARWLLAVMSGLLGLSYGLAGLQDLGSPPSLMSLLVSVILAWTAGVLALSKPVARFLTAARLRHP